MSFRTVVTQNLKPLSASEDRVLNVLLGSTTSAATAAEVAARARTHESTVVRLAQKLGYRGYPDLRADLRRDEEDEEQAVEAAVPVMRAATGHELPEFLADEIRALERLPQFVSQEDLDAAARTVHAGGTVYLFSSVDEGSSVHLLARRLRRLGLTVVTLTPTPKDLAERFASFEASSTFIAFAMREAPRQLPNLISEATRRGGRSIIISDVPGYRFRPDPDHLLTARRGEDSEYRTQIVPIALAYALQLAIYHLDPARYRRVRDGIDDLTRLLGGTEEIPLRL